MKMSRQLCFGLICVAALCNVALANTCSSPKVSVQSFSTQDATILTQLAHIAEITLKCGNEVTPNLFAEFPCGKVVPVAQVGGGKYQLSWTQDIKQGSSGNVVVRLFDEAGYANVRRAQRDGEKVGNVKSLIDVTVSTKGAYKGPWVNAELVAELIGGAIAYFAFMSKNKLLA